jgi:hypothetical protein
MYPTMPSMCLRIVRTARTNGATHGGVAPGLDQPELGERGGEAHGEQQRIALTNRPAHAGGHRRASSIALRPCRPSRTW